ncbi:MAG: sigma-E processing peptidase SpoIIGA [Syntrophomonadaceae bacterium]|nr:sigma-E processing peptidase SpoIIGA [Syntrophomonadaceae bacterium]
MDGPKVYADVTFAINLLMDFIILWATARLAGSRVIYFRLFTAALLGAVYSVLYLYFAMTLYYSVPAKLLFSCLLLVIGLAPHSWTEFKKALVYFYGISFTVAGASIAASYLAAVPGQGFSFSYLWLLAGATFALLIGVFGEKYLLRRIVPNLLRFGVELRFGAHSCNGQGFLDTGNGLKDPLTKRPVVVAEYEFLKPCLPQDFQQAFDDNRDEDDILNRLSHSSWANRLRIIPFSSIGRKNGILVGVRADSILVNMGKKNVLHNNVVIGIYRDKLSQDGSYHLLIPSEIVNQG